MNRCLRVVVIATLVIAGTPAAGRVVPIDPRLSEWMILKDIPPFVHSELVQRFKAGGVGFYGGSFLMDDDAGNMRAETLYRDETRNMGSSVEI